MRPYAAPARLLALLLPLALLSPASARPALTVAAASNVQFALDSLKAGFSAARGVEVAAVYGSSGKLAAQIRVGAPFDVFVSADAALPDSVAAWGLASGKPRVYARGLLVLWTARADLDPGRGLSLVAAPSVRRIALPDPALAPYGREALAALERAGLAAAAGPKLVLAQNVGQAGQFVLSGAADIGFNAKAVAAAPAMRGRGRWAELDRAAYRPIDQAAVALRRGTERDSALARAFLDHLHGPSGRAVLAAFGYLPPAPDPSPGRAAP